MGEMRQSADESPVNISVVLEEYGRFIRHTITKLCPRNLGIQFDDIEQDARLRLWRALQSERKIRDVTSYIYRIVASATIDAVRRVKARREQQFEPAEDETYVEEKKSDLWAASHEDSPEQVAGYHSLLGRVEAALKVLSEGRRRAVALLLQGFTTQEIGNLLGWSEPKARNLVHRGLKEVRLQMESDRIESG